MRHNIQIVGIEVGGYPVDGDSWLNLRVEDKDRSGRRTGQNGNAGRYERRNRAGARWYDG